MYPSIILAVGLGGLVGFWFLRLWETRRGVRLWEERRRALDTAVSEAYRAVVAGDALVTHRMHIFAVIHSLSHRALTVLVILLRTIERPLARISHRMRMSPPKVATREPSDFLKTLTPEKKSADTTDTL
jgi:hypothetical protein